MNDTPQIERKGYKVNDLYFTAKNKKACKDETIQAILHFCCKTYEKGQTTLIWEIKKHNTDIFRINIIVSLCERATKRIQNPNGFILQNRFTFLKKWVQF